jgi:hypothetical protein
MATTFTITPGGTEAVCGHLRDGAYFTTACRLAGVPAETAKEWLARGENRHHRHPTAETRAFAEAVNAASAEAEERALRTVLGGQRGWQGPAWFLERRFPSRWAQRRIDEHDQKRTAEALVAIYRTLVSSPELDLTEEQIETARLVLRAELRRYIDAQGVDVQGVDPLHEDEV